MMQARIAESEISAFEENGAVCLRGHFDRHWLDSLAEGVEKNFEDPGPDSTVYTPDGAPGGFYDDYCNWRRIPEYEDFVRHAPAAEIAGQLMRSERARIYHEHVLVKEPGTQEVTPWHHDLPYYGVDGRQLCSIWLPLDPVPKAACPEFVAGSHRWEKLFYPKLFVSHENYGQDTADAGAADYATVPDIDAERDSHQILSWDLEPGDCIAFHMRTLHGAPATAKMKTRRRGFSTRWLGDDARFAVRPWKTSPPFSEAKLEPGQAMDHPSFPVIWQQAR